MFTDLLYKQIAEHQWMIQCNECDGHGHIKIYECWCLPDDQCGTYNDCNCSPIDTKDCFVCNGDGYIEVDCNDIEMRKYIDCECQH